MIYFFVLSPLLFNLHVEGADFLTSDPNWTHTGHTCYFASFTHGPLATFPQSATHALYAFRSDCKLIGYVPSLTLGMDEKFSFSSQLPKFIDVKYKFKKGYGWAPQVWYDGQHWPNSKCWYEDRVSNPIQHDEGACKIWFYC